MKAAGSEASGDQAGAGLSRCSRDIRPLLSLRRFHPIAEGSGRLRPRDSRSGAVRPAPPQSRAILTRCRATGIIARTLATIAGSIRVDTTPTPSDALATTWPHGSATSEWP